MPYPDPCCFPGGGAMSNPEAGAGKNAVGNSIHGAEAAKRQVRPCCFCLPVLPPRC